MEGPREAYRNERSDTIMAGITMCSNAGECPYRDRCQRHTAIPTERQSWAGFHTLGEKCNHFMGGYPYPPKEGARQ